MCTELLYIFSHYRVHALTHQPFELQKPSTLLRNMLINDCENY